MNDEIQKSIIYLYTAFNALDMEPNNTKLSIYDGINIDNALNILYKNLVGTYSMNGYVHIRMFYDTCRRFYYYGLQMKGVFNKYFVYDYYRLHECVEELDRIYDEILKYI